MTCGRLLGRASAGRLFKLLMDFQTLKLTYDALPPGAKAACAKVGTAVLGKVLGGAWNAVAGKTPGAVFAGIYQQWRNDLLEAEADDEKLAAEFFSRKPTIQELDKLLQDRSGKWISAFSNGSFAKAATGPDVPCRGAICMKRYMGGSATCGLYWKTRRKTAVSSTSLCRMPSAR
jgi:hypothetical protein